jgi:hypothetical protein
MGYMPGTKSSSCQTQSPYTLKTMLQQKAKGRDAFIIVIDKQNDKKKTQQNATHDLKN